MAEKFSKFRDPGTGIQVFLTPVAAASAASGGSGSSGLGGIAGLILTPLFLVLGVIRALVGGVFWGLYRASGSAGLIRIVLGALGFWSLPVEVVAPGGNNRRAKQNVGLNKMINEAKKGDLVVANHSSYVDVLILAYLYPGIKYVLPVIADSAKEEVSVKADASNSQSGARRTPKKNAMSANTRMVTPTSSSAAASSVHAEIAVQGLAVVNLTTALRFVGALPPSTSEVLDSTVYPDLDSTVKAATGVLALFPEVVTSNNRALLNITLLPSSIPTSLKTTHVITFKYPPPSNTSTTSVYSAPSPANSIFNHVVNVVLLSSPVRSVNIRQTVLSANDAEDNNWGEQVATTMSSMARLKRTSIDWWSKKEFLGMVQARNKRA